MSYQLICGHPAAWITAKVETTRFILGGQVRVRFHVCGTCRCGDRVAFVSRPMRLSAALEGMTDKDLTEDGPVDVQAILAGGFWNGFHE